ncbi:AfsR/SARP family transcriptional regulator, partial [Yinghuangia sp. YIM S09857]|uniref:AfsR/SARP family transcriptional regulator n=1 Tax=Yinghuangia sp. YIM S09857 TaxID=3436929 RepID=UPI003F52BCAF
MPEGKVRGVLAALLAHHGAPVSADRLIDDVWGDEPPGNPANTLQTKVSQLRRALDLAEPGARGLVAYLPAGYLLQVEDDAVDAARFSALVARARRETEPTARVTLLTDALALWRGPAFADFRDAEFTRAAVTRLEEQRLTAVEDLAELRLDLGEHALVADEIADLVAAHPLRERLRTAQMRALYRAGRQADALAAYQDLRGRLADELGLDPGDAVTALHQAILVRAPELAAPAAPVASAARPTTNLPVHLDAPVGRDAAIARMCGLLDASRLVTLVGPGGVGKTRLALAAAAARARGDHPRHAVDPFPDGVWLVELAALAPGKDALAPAVAATLGLRDDVGPGSALDRLTALLRDRRLLLLLDNCEHVVDEVAELAARLLRDAAGVRLLATSQEPLAIAGEVVEAVVPLEEADAVSLFAARAAATSPGFALDHTNSQTVAAICQRLDHLPLAIELAAARVRALGLDELAARLGDRFRVLAAGG